MGDARERALAVQAFLTLLALLSAPHPASAYYEPGAQRWINRDPIQEVVGPNLYAFVYNAPEGLVDTFGHSTENDCFTQCIQDNLHSATTYPPRGCE